jgi:hypothetical protein
MLPFDLNKYFVQPLLMAEYIQNICFPKKETISDS